MRPHFHGSGTVSHSRFLLTFDLAYPQLNASDRWSCRTCSKTSHYEFKIFPTQTYNFVRCFSPDLAARKSLLPITGSYYEIKQIAAD